MARLERGEVIIIDDVIITIDDEEDDDFKITSWNKCVPGEPLAATLAPKRMQSCVSLLVLSDDEPPKTMPHPLILSQGPSDEPRFQTPNYGPRGSCPTNRMSSARSPRSLRRHDSLPTPSSSAQRLHRGRNYTGNDLGTLADPISVDNLEDDTDSTTFTPQSLQSIGSGRLSEVDSQQQLRSGGDDALSSDVSGHPPSEEDEPEVQRNIAQSVERMAVIDLDELEDDQEDELRILAVQNIRPEDEQTQTPPRPARSQKTKRRNPSIVEPWRICPGYQHGSMLLKPNKTVELTDGDFLRIREIILNSETSAIRVRGNRFQRTRDLNGVLERKMNEVVLFLEVDLDDPRPHLEQSAIEIPLTEMRKIRSLRLTNHKFPLDRNLDPTDFRNRDQINVEGGLTCRWKYTCLYATGVDREHNVYKERRLERLRMDECSSANALPDSDRRSQWREQTIAGGSHRPWIVEPPSATLEHASISIRSSPEPGSNTDSPSSQDIVVQSEGSKRTSNSVTATLARAEKKRKHSAVDSTNSIADGQTPKRPRYGNDTDVEETRRRLSTYTIKSDIAEPHALDSSMSIDAPSNAKDPSARVIELSPDATPFISEPINLIPSNLSIPPPSGSIHTLPLIPPAPVHRHPGQKLTYGDAFCGGGGSTRGALMAGLHVKWGFDFNPHACSTWTANFPNAKCYKESAHDFVSRVQRSSRKHLFKVDILHLSPPCQFFSPAHTVDGQDDEMNLASLFAVRSVIEAARPRVVTLEQTFGIESERFRWFFNALVQMFTSHDFSVRWAIIPLQQWGLPQRRTRLIIIASCPGEILPRMPDPTHTENPPPGSTLKPHVSVNSILQSIPLGAPDHDPNSVIFAGDRRMINWDSSKILPRAMTTSGGQNYHPSGRRDFTLREYACLQGFPICHLFKGNYVKKQIGNAVPPVVAKVLFESVKRDLDRADGIVDGVEVLD